MKQTTEDNVIVNSPRAWFLATRPKTLAGAAVPVMIALALAWADCQTAGKAFRWVPAVLCMLFAFVMQIDSNLINDYFDFVHGNDDETRLGPARACASGWVTKRAMQTALVLTTLMGCCIGLPLIIYGGWTMIAVGVACVAFAFLYTTTLSYLGLGDVLVLVFFGIVPVTITYYLQTGSITWEAFTASVACGLVIDTMLIVNNYRDIDNDRRSGKMTLIVRIGAKAALWLFLLIGYAACALGVVYALSGHVWALVLPLFYLIIHTMTWRQMKSIGSGRRLNHILGINARDMFFYGVLMAVGFIIG